MPCVSSMMLMAERALSVSPWAARTRWITCLTVSRRRSPAMRMLESRISPKASVPCRRIARLAVADDLFQIGGELRVHHRLEAHLFRMGFGKCDGFREQASARLDGHAQHHGGRSFFLDDDLRAC